MESSTDQDYVVLVHRKKKVTTREELEKLSSEVCLHYSFHPNNASKHECVFLFVDRNW